MTPRGSPNGTTAKRTLLTHFEQQFMDSLTHVNALCVNMFSYVLQWYESVTQHVLICWFDPRFRVQIRIQSNQTANTISVLSSRACTEKLNSNGTVVISLQLKTPLKKCRSNSRSLVSGVNKNIKAQLIFKYHVTEKWWYDSVLHSVA